MPHIPFRPSFALWPRPQFLGRSTAGFAAWIIAGRDIQAQEKRDLTPARAVRQFIEDYHDEHGQTIRVAKRANV